VVAEIVADEIGTAAMLLGAGRATKESEIDLAVGLMLNKKVGDAVQKGDSLVTIHANREDVAQVLEKIYANIRIADHAEAPVLIYGTVTE
jgi:pyrimidine-nucleoside phosphorylase